MDRPPRKTKVVNYSEAKDFDDDDDFAAPPSKRPREDVRREDVRREDVRREDVRREDVRREDVRREDVRLEDVRREDVRREDVRREDVRREDVRREHKKSPSASSTRESNSQPAESQKSRRPLDVKVYERDLEAAITLSSLNNGGGTKDQSSTRKDVQICVPVDENTDPTSAPLSNCSVNLTALGLDEITSEKEATSISRQRKAATEEQKKRPVDEDEDYVPKLTPGSESDDDFSEPAESEDEEFTVKKVSKTKKEKVSKNEKTKAPPTSKEEKQPPKPPKPPKPSQSKSQAAAASTPVRSPPTPKLAPKIPPSSPSVSTSTPALPLSPMGGRVPKWNPPAQVGKSRTSSGPAVKSPGQGLRLGLSRLVRVKPLHPGVSSP